MSVDRKNVYKDPSGARFEPGPDQGLTFSGTLDCDNTIGAFYNDYAQSGALVVAIGSNALVGAGGRIKITADGNTITLDPAYTWKNIGSDSIGTTAADVNIIYFLKVSATVMEYSVKLN